MDKTQSFKAAVMTIKVQRKGEIDKNRILPKTGSAPRDEFAKQAKDVVNKITNLRNVLIENRAAYMRIGQHLRKSAHMSDEQRDLIDRESEKFFTYYTQHLGQMRSDWKRSKRKAQQRDHIEAVIELLNSYLRHVQQIHIDMKKYRVQYELETYRLMKLAADKKLIPIRPGGLLNNDSNKNKKFKSNNSESDAASEVDWNDGWEIEEDENENEVANESSTQKQNESSASRTSDVDGKSISSQQVALDEDMQKSQQLDDDEAKGLSPEDIQMFEEENVQLLHELQGLSEEVDQIEKNVVDIAQLQDIFTEKVYTQQQNIERIANAVIGATENVKDGNEQIVQAIQRNAGLRVWSLFFLLVMSFALLFLDWYYD